MRRFVIRRLLLSVLTLVVILIIITLIPNVAPGDPARKIAGGTASPERLQAVTESLGLDKSVGQQLVDVAVDTVRFDFGEAFTKNESVTTLVRTSLWNSAKLVLFSLVLMLPVSIAGGIWAAYRRDTWIDRLIVNGGVALAALPDFVVGVLFLALLGVPIGFFKVTAIPPDPDAGLLSDLQYMLLPALVVVVVYFGYIARITRASTITSLDADYTRTAFMKGLPTGQVFRKHVVRNSLLPTVAVVGTQLGYLFGGMVALETIYNYPGLGKLIFDAVDSADYPVLRGGVLTVAIIYMVATLGADLLIAWMNPRARLSLSEGS